MSENTKIEWADHTHNFWEGCQKTGPGCDHCYAETRNVRFNGGQAINWGPGAPRRRTSDANWLKPLKWQAEAAAFFAEHGRRQRVFSLSLGDWLDNAVPIGMLVDALDVIRRTPDLNWLLLSKRIGNFRKRMEQAHDEGLRTPVTACDVALKGWISRWLDGDAPDNIWIGATVVNQAEANRDIPKLVEAPAHVRFLSMEPLLGHVDILKWLDPFTCADCGFHGSENDAGSNGCEKCGELFGGGPNCENCGADDQAAKRSCPQCGSHRSFERDHGFKFDSQKRLIDWVIVGGESGAGARPMHAQWARSLRDQCVSVGVPYLFKQWGEWLPWHHFGCARVEDPPEQTQFKTMEFEDEAWHDVGHPDVWDTRDGNVDDMQCVGRVGKRAAGRLLDGVEHNGFPVLS